MELAFGLPGVHNLALWRALGDSPIRLVGVRHEQTAAYAADGYARATGRLGVALTTTGPGAANTLGAVGEAWASRQPVLVIATDIPARLRRPGRLARPAARGHRPGRDVRAGGQADAQGPLGGRARARRDRGGPRRARPAGAAGLPRGAHRPARRPRCPRPREPTPRGAARPPPRPRAPGPGRRAARARAAAARLGRRRRAPGRRGRSGRAARRAAGCARDPHLLGARAAGRPATRAWSTRRRTCRRSGALWDEADAVVAIGTDFDGMMTQGWKQPQPPRLVAINVDPADASKNYLPDVLIEADAAEGAAALAERHRRARPGSTSLGRRMRELNRAVRAELERERSGGAAVRRGGRARPARRRRGGLRHVHPGLLARRLPPHARAARARLPARVGHAGLRASRRGSAPRSPARGRP